MITENQVNQFERQAKDDALRAFNEMLSSFQKQDAQARDISNNVAKYKKKLSEWAAAAHYRIDWSKFTAAPFKMVGDCTRCNMKNVGLLAYNEYGCNVCESCFDRLNDEFDEEYR